MRKERGLQAHARELEFSTLRDRGTRTAALATRAAIALLWAQYRTRDGGVASGTGLTNGLAFTLCE